MARLVLLTIFDAYPRWGRGKKIALLLAGFVMLTVPASAGISADLVNFLKAKRAAIDTTLRTGEPETYLAGYGWHAPSAYDRATRERLNENTWGGGFGRTSIDADGKRHSVYFMGFVDSHRDAQFNAGYSCLRYLAPMPKVEVGYGYMAFLFSRKDVMNHLPIPALLPCASIAYRSVELRGMFVPHVSNDIKGNVIFLFLRFAH